MRIIAGDLRSRVLQTPRGTATRPTSDRLRETLFNILQPRLARARFLDLYAGSGANALEALSRGAHSAVLVEQAPPALAAIRANIAALQLARRAEVQATSVRRWLQTLAPADAQAEAQAEAQAPAPFDILFLDPPYDAADEYTATLGALGGSHARLIAPGGLVVAEHRRPRPGSDSSPRTQPQSRPQPRPTPPSFQPAPFYGRLRQSRRIEQGDAALSFFQLVPHGDTLPPSSMA